MAKYDRKQLMHRVQIALRELHLASWTNADKKRLYYVEQGLHALDEEQAMVKSGIEDLLEEYQKTANAPSSLGGLTTELERHEAVVRATEKLISGLQKLVKEDKPRVAYPDRKLLEPPAAPKV